MKLIATISDDSGNVAGVVHGPELGDQEITVNGRGWRFDFDKLYGPLWLRNDGYERKCQCPGKSVWKAFEKWEKMMGV